MSSDFQVTRWTLVQRAQGSSSESRAALGELCALCYAPVEGFIRRWCGNAEESRDLTQEFFSRLLKKQSLGGADPEQGRFRSFLLGAVKHFLCDAKAHAYAWKRGGGFEHVPLASLDETHASNPGIADASVVPPDAEFDRRWALTMLDRALQSLEETMEAEGKSSAFAAMKPWLTGLPRDGSHAEAAAQLGLNDGALRVAVHRLRQRFRDQLRREVAQTLAPQAEVDEELRHLLAALSPRAQ